MPVLNKLRDSLYHLFLPRSSNNQRSRLLHPAGLSIIVGIFLLNFAARTLISSLPNLVLGFSSSISVEEVINLTNQERAKAGLPPLTQNAQLTQAALAKASDMYAQDYWAHTSPKGVQPWSFIRNAGYSYRHAGENLARDFSDSASMMSAWMASSSHKENILNAHYRDIGVAVVDGTLQGLETRLVVQMFAAPAALPVAKPQKTQEETAEPAAQSAQEENLKPVASQQETVSKNQQEPVLPSEKTNFGNQKTAVQLSKNNILQAIDQPQKTEILIAPTQVTQVFGMLLITLILGTLAVDWVIAHKKNMVRLVGKNWAHLSFLGAVALMMLQYAQGKIL
jgi:hypothetical protein